MYQDPVEENAPQENPVDFLEKERQLIAYELRENVHKTLALLRLYIRLPKPTVEDELEIRSRSLKDLDLVMMEIQCLSNELTASIGSTGSGALGVSGVSGFSGASGASSASGAWTASAGSQIPLKGLVESLRGLIEFIRLSKGIAIGFDNDLETYPIDVGKKLALFRIVQAQLENILELPTPTAANIILTLVNQHVQLIIQDNSTISFAGAAGEAGRNDGSSAGQAGRIGQRISFIRERVRFYQGTFELESRKDGGRKLTVTIPVHTLPGRHSSPVRGR